MSPALEQRVASVQAALADVYRLDLTLCASDYVLPPEEAQALLPEAGPRTGVLVLDEGEDLWLGVYFHERDVDDADTIAEETSHWVRLVWNALCERPISQLQLELQGEVDQYVVRRLSGGDPLGHLGDVEWGQWMDPETLDRYVTAHRVARRYCIALERRYPHRCDLPSWVAELRHFYRAEPDARLRAGG